MSQTADAQEFLVLDLDGKVVVSTVGAHERRDQAKEEYFTRGSSGTYVQPVAESSLTEEPTITVATPLFGRDGQRIGVVAANLNLERLDRIVLPATGLGRTGESYLVGKDGLFVHTRLRTGQYAGGASSTAIDGAMRGAGGRGLYDNYAGVPVIGVYQWLDEIGAALVAEQSQDAAFAPARRLALTLAGIGLAVAALLAAAIYAASRRIARPILAITDTAAAVAAGDLTREAPVTTRDEVGMLAVAFNTMTSRLRETLEGLEQRVAERTEELRIQNAELGALHETTLGVMHRLDVVDLLKELLERAGELLNSGHGYIYVRRPGEQEIERRVAIGVFEGDMGRRMAPGEGLAGRVWATGEPLVIDDYDGVGRPRADHPAWSDPSARGGPPHLRQGRDRGAGDRSRPRGRSFLRRLGGRASAALRAARIDRPGQCAAVRGRAGGSRGSRCGERREEHVPRRDEPRDPDADERCDRDERAAAAQRARRRAARLRLDDPHQQRGAADDHQRHPRLLQDRGGPDGARGGAVRPARMRRRRRRADRDAGVQEGNQPEQRAPRRTSRKWSWAT